MELTNTATTGADGLDQDAVYERLNRVRQIRARPFYVEIVESLTYGEVAEIFAARPRDHRRDRRWG